jgi:hypothetical protein
MRQVHQSRFRFNDRQRAWDALPAAVRDVVVEQLRDLWLAAFRRQLEAMRRDDDRQDPS